MVGLAGGAQPAAQTRARATTEGGAATGTRTGKTIIMQTQAYMRDRDLQGWEIEEIGM